MAVIKIEGPFNSKEIHNIYDGLMESDFYNEGYNADTQDWPYKIMADIIVKLFDMAPGARVYDLGSGRGGLVRSFIQKGLKAKGIEFSRRMIGVIPEPERSHFQLVDSIQDMDFAGLQLLVSMEVFEHLPMALTVANLAHIREVYDGYIFLTIPSSGKDRTLPDLGHTEVNEQRLASMAANVVCPYLVMEDGYVGGGHITLAGYRWWEDFFLTQGFARQTSKEREYGGFLPDLKSKGLMWCCYVMRALSTDDVVFGRGWYDSEGSYRWNGPDAEMQFISKSNDFELECQFTLPDANVMPDPRLEYFIEQVGIADDYRMESRVIGSGRLELSGAGRDHRVSLPVRRQVAASVAGDFPREDGALKDFTAYKVRFHTPLWRPCDYSESQDQRLLGFRLEAVRVTPSKVT